MLGYACINENLRAVGCLVNRTVRLSNLTPDVQVKLALKNLDDLEKVYNWNIANGILFYRISSSVIPFPHLNNILKNHDVIDKLSSLSKYASKLRLTFHPGPYNKLASVNPTILDATKAELEYHSEFMDIHGLSASPYNKINIHMGGAYTSKLETSKIFCKNFKTLSKNLQKRLTIENDDRPALYTNAQLYEMVHQEIGIPLVFDIHHHSITVSTDYKNDIYLASTTWPKDIIPVVHYSESEPGAKIKLAHSAEIITDNIELYGVNADIMIEAKNKEKKHY